MKSIECIGPSGIGKSTFCRFMRDRAIESGDDQGWMLHTEALKEAGFYENPGLLTRIRLKFNKPDVPPPSELFRRYSDDLAGILAVFERGVRESDPEPWQKIHISEYFYQNILYRALLLHHSFNNKKVILFDEGIVHNGGYQIGNGSELPEGVKAGDLIQSPVFPTAVIHFTLNDDEYRGRISDRFQQAGRRDLNRIRSGLKPAEITEIMEKERTEAKNKAELCRTIGIPVLEIESRTSDENFRKVHGLIESLK